MNLAGLSQPWQYVQNYPILFAQNNELAGSLIVSQNVSQTNTKKILPILIEVLAESVAQPIHTLWNRSIETNLTTLGPVIINYNGHGKESRLSSGFQSLILVAFVGYYRCNYDIHNWELIIQMLQENYTDIEPITRSLLIDDAFYLVKNGHLNYSILIGLIKCWYSYEIEYLPWLTLLNNLDTFYQQAYDLSIFSEFKVSPNAQIKILEFVLRLLLLL